MTDTLFTIQEQNEYNAYDKLYPKTHASLIVNPPQATGARIDVTCLPASAGIAVNLSGQKTASATTDSSGKCIFEKLDYGEYTISATISGSEKSETVNIDASKIHDVSLGVSKTLNDNSWEVISAVSKAGLASNYWSVGDSKAVTLNGIAGSSNGLTLNTTLYCYILGFNHDMSSEGGDKDGITFGTFKTAVSNGSNVCLINNLEAQNSFFCMNTASVNSGGWRSSYMRYSILGSTNTPNSDATSTTATSPASNTLMSCLPSDLRAVMRPMYIYTDNTGGGSNTASYVTGTLDYLPLLAEVELFGVRNFANVGEQNYQTQYQYYKNGNSKVKYSHVNISSSVLYWGRSPYYYNSREFFIVNNNGTATATSANYSYGVAPIFKV
nr:MAG TPA: putative transglutaminase-family protein [Caudoviricetes sp.]